MKWDLIQTVEIPKKIKEDAFLLFLIFCFSSRRPTRRSGFYHVQYPLEKFSFSWRQHLCGLFDLRLFFQGSLVKGHTYINGMLHNYLHEERAWAGCRRICHVLRLLFSRFLGIPWICFPLVEIRETECWLQHSYSTAFNFLSVELFWYKLYAGKLVLPVWVMIFKLSSAPHAQSETKQEAPACLFHVVLWSLQSEASCVGLAR